MAAGETVRETVAHLVAGGERIGVAQVRLYRPFPARALVDALPAVVRRVAVLDRTKEPGSFGEPLPAGADVVMTASALPRHGPEHAAVLLDGQSAWMARRGFATVDQFRGMLAVPPGTDETAYERAGYVGALRAANSSAFSSP
jgi:hypothetical protein